MKGVYISLIGMDRKRVSELCEEIEREVQGKAVTEEEVREAKADKSLKE